MCLKINWSEKAPWHRPSMGVARSRLRAPEVTQYRRNMLKFFRLCSSSRAAFRIRCNLSSCFFESLNRRLSQKSILLVTKAWTSFSAVV